MSSTQDDATCRKIKYPTRELAERDVELLVGSGKARFLKVYGCRQHGERVWHISSKRPQDCGKGAKVRHNLKRRAAWRLPVEIWEGEGGALAPNTTEGEA